MAGLLHGHQGVSKSRDSKWLGKVGITQTSGYEGQPTSITGSKSPALTDGEKRESGHMSNT